MMHMPLLVGKLSKMNQDLLSILAALLISVAIASVTTLFALWDYRRKERKIGLDLMLAALLKEDEKK